MNTKKNVIKIFGAVIMLILLFSTGAEILSSATTANITFYDGDDSSQDSSPKGYTHTVLGEYGTTTTCPYCPPVSGFLYTIYTSGSYDFCYVSLVSNKNSLANARCGELGISAVPTVVFDGGYSRLVGNYGSTGPYINQINNCGSRDVKDIEINMEVTWDGPAKIGVNIGIMNNEGESYSGHLHAYVTEIESRWDDASGDPYHYAMIGYAFNQNINIPAGDTLNLSTIWDGNTHGFSDIVRNNIMIVASVFRSGTDYVDESAASPVIDDVLPEWQDQGQNRSTIQRGESISLYAQGKDNDALDWAYLATNETGEWKNITGDYGSPMDLGGVGGEWVWSIFTWQNQSIPQGAQVGWRVYYVDSSGNVNVTDIMSFTILHHPLITDNTPNVAYTGEEFTFNASIVDDDDVDTAWVEYWYGTGEHTNATLLDTGVDDFILTITIPVSSIDTLHYIISANDTLNHWGNTEIKNVTLFDIIDPEWRNQGQNESIINFGGNISLYAQGKDNVALDYAFLSINETGEWLNYSGEEWWDMEWGYSKEIVIDHTLVEGDLIDFPVLIMHTSSDFAGHAQPDGDDFVFVDISNATQYAHEIEYYDGATGELVAWVNVPFVSASEDTVFYLYYGNQTCDSHENKEGTWNSDFRMVHHMIGDAYTDLDDSTLNSFDVTSAGGDPSYNQDGKISRCVDFDGSGDYLKTAGFTLPTDSSHTGSAWVYVDGGTGNRRYAFEGDSDYGISLLVWTDDRFKNYARASGGTSACYSTTTIDTSMPEWFYICTRADADNDQLDIFVNGVSEDNTAISGTINPETQGLNIGTYRDNNNYYMNGKIDEIRISDVPRSDSWIKTEYNNMVSPSTFLTIGSENIRSGGEKYGSPMDLGGVGGEWVWSNFTWQNPEIPPGTQVEWRIYYVDSSGNMNCTDISHFYINISGIICGDMNNDGTLNLGDVVYLINYLFRSGPEPVPLSCVGDCNHDGEVTLGDVVYLINYLFRGGPPPVENCCG